MSPSTNPKPDVAEHRPRILIVDDERPNRELLKVMLTPEGFLPLTATSGEEALAMVAQEPPDLILLDVMMPGLDGYQVAAKLKGGLSTRNIPVIMVTALDDRNARMLGLSAGVEDFLTKPVDRAELCVRVRNLLRLKAYGDSHDKYSRMLEGEVAARTSELAQRTKQAAGLTEEAARLDQWRLLCERMSLAFSMAKCGVWEWDLSSKTLIWDATMFEIYGIPPVVPMPYARWSAAVHPEDLPAVEATRQRAIHEGGQATVDFRIILADGSVRKVSAIERAILDDRATVGRIVGVDIDVTERKEAEDALERGRRAQTIAAVSQFSAILLDELAGEVNKEQHDYERIVLKNIGRLRSMIDEMFGVVPAGPAKLTVEPARHPGRAP